MRVWLDTDVGDNPDDSVALLVARAHPDLELVGVSTAGGHADQRVAVARRFVGSDVVVVPEGEGVVDAVFQASPDVFVALGPLGNLSRLTGHGGSFRRVAMAGLLDPVEHRGERREVETNAGADPLATAAVVRSGLTTLVPLDVTRHFRVGEEGRAVLGAWHPDLASHLESWPHELVLHDPLAVLIACGLVGARFELRGLAVGDDGRFVEGSHRCPVVVEADVDGARRVVQALAERGGSQAPMRSARPPTV